MPELIDVPMLTLLHGNDDVFPISSLDRPELATPPLGTPFRHVELLRDLHHVPTGPSEAGSFATAVSKFATALSAGELAGTNPEPGDARRIHRRA